MLKYLTTILFLTITSITVSADDLSVTLKQGNEAYLKNDYSEALNSYLSVFNQGYMAPELFYNMGNCYVQLDSLPQSILFYERASKLDPSDEDIKYNLQLANLKVVDKIEAIPEFFAARWLKYLGGILTSNQWSSLFLGLLWILAALIVWFWISKSIGMRRLSFMLAGLCVLFIILTLGLSVQQKHHEYEELNGVVFVNSAFVKNSPDDKGTNLFVIHKGLKIQVLDEVGGWKKIKLADGNVGWLVGNSIQII
ncbi:hypothetical protein JYU23_01055 [bacterium AH-315-C07]|nr:hypothetical protein [bacterium AH-315-C07]